MTMMFTGTTPVRRERINPANAEPAAGPAIINVQETLYKENG